VGSNLADLTLTQFEVSISLTVYCKWVFSNFKKIDFWIDLKSTSYLKLRQSVSLTQKPWQGYQGVFG